MDETTRQKKERSIWDRMAGSYDDRTLKRYERAYALSIRKTQAVLAPDHRVLEIGCGTGIVSLAIAPSVKQAIATDISPEMVAAARRKAGALTISNVTFRVADGYALPYDAGSFNAVLLFNVLHFVKQPAALLQEAHRLLASSGHLVSATDCYAEPAPLPTRLMLGAQKILNLLGIIPYTWYYTKADLHRLFEQNAFAVVETDVLHPAPVNYYLLARRTDA